MKKFMLSLATLWVALFTSCDKEQELKPFPVGSWHTTYRNVIRRVNDAYPDPETVKEMRNMEDSDPIAEADSYRLTFLENGTGSGSGVHPDGSGRYDFDFTWQLSDGELTITGTRSGNEDEPVFYFRNTLPDILNMNFNDVNVIWEDMVWRRNIIPTERVYWDIEVSSADNMVLSTFIRSATVVTGVAIELDETFFYRYTFEREK